MEKETVIKALECCITKHHENCCKLGKWHEEWNCMTDLMQDALALIKELTEANVTQIVTAIELDKQVERLTEENERLKQLNDSYAEIEQGYIVTGVKKVQADTLNDMQTRFAMHFGTYRPTDEVKVTEVFKLLKKISGEMLYEEEECPSCKHFVGCECFDGETCDLYEKNTEDEKE